MPNFTFQHCLEGRRLPLASVELDNRDAALNYGVGLAEKILRGHEGPPQAVCRIVVCDPAGEDVGTIISESV